MELPGDRTGVEDKDKEPAGDKAAEQTPATSKTVARQRELRERGAGRPRSGVSASFSDLNGAASSPQSSGRVLRNRSTRAVPAWLKDSKSDDEEDEPNLDTITPKRRKVSSSRRKKHSESVGCEAGGVLADAGLQTTE